MLNLNVAFVIWRELFEVVLVVTIIHAYLAQRLEKGATRRLIASGLGVGLAVSIALGILFQAIQSQLSGDALDHFQTGILILCALLMTRMCLWMKAHARSMKKELESSLATALDRSSRLFVISMIAVAFAREGLEIVIYVFGMGFAEGSLGNLAVGTLVGAALAALSALALWRGIKFVKPALMFKVTGAFLLITASSLLVRATTKLMQSDVIPALVYEVWDTSAILDDRSPFGEFFSTLTGYQSNPALIVVLVYAAYWLVYALLSRRVGRAAPRSLIPGGAKAVTVLALAMIATGARGQAAGGPNEKLKTRVTGYGDMRFAYYDYGANRNLKEGAQHDSRAVFDATRFVARVEGFYLPHDVEFEAEIEFEHGGTGAETELEYEEFGEYETEVSKGGEVYLEEFYLKKYLGSDTILTAGRIKVAVGLLALYDQPTDYLAVNRAEAEWHLIPESWNEMGADAFHDFGDVQVRAQVVNGLDSTGFSSQYWVAKGHQSKFEETRATDLAYVARVDYLGIGGVTVGSSVYHGNSARNRPKPDMVKKCDKSRDEEVAPCGYIDAKVTIVDLHLQVRLEKLRANALVLHGKLSNAGSVSERNKNAKAELGVLRSPVADEALSYWGEVGYDVAPTFSMANSSRLEPFVRCDYYDTMYKVKSGQIDNPRFERRLATLGVAYTVDEALFAKFDVSRRTYGARHLNPEDTAEIGLGFIY